MKCHSAKPINHSVNQIITNIDSKNVVDWREPESHSSLHKRTSYHLIVLLQQDDDSTQLLRVMPHKLKN